MTVDPLLPRRRSAHPARTCRLPFGAVLIAALIVLIGLNATASSARTDDGSRVTTAALDRPDWVWPAVAFRLEKPFVAPAHDYAPGHRGIDLRVIGGNDVRTPAAGVVAFSGQVAGRGILTIDHGGGLVTTLEPVDSHLKAGDPVDRADSVGALAAGGHTSPGELHFGVRLDGAYINPLLLLGGVPRAVLLPCC